MTPEDRARIARENGAKSKGPITPEGKDRSARNALKNGERAEKYAHFVPPHPAILCNESRQTYEKVVAELHAIYKPCNQAASAIVGDMAFTRWQIERLKRVLTMQWNLALVTANDGSSQLAPELHDFHAMIDAAGLLLGPSNLLPKINREIDRLKKGILTDERRLKFLHANFPDFAYQQDNKQTQPENERPVENEALSDPEPENGEKIDETLPPVYTSENAPEVIAPAEIGDFEHDANRPIPRAPRKAA